MGYDWVGNSEGGEGSQRAPKIPPGQRELEITKVVYGKRGEPPFASNDGDPQIMLVFGDGQGNESGQMVTLSAKAAWVLAGILRAAGANLQKMVDGGIEPDYFADPTTESMLVGRRLLADVSYRTNGGKEYLDLHPLMRQPGQPPAQQAPATQQQRHRPAAAPPRSAPPQRQQTTPPPRQQQPAFNPEADLVGAPVSNGFKENAFKESDIPF